MNDESRGSDDGGSSGAFSNLSDVSLAYRVAVGLGDPERERIILPALSQDQELVVAERCLSADDLLSSVRDRGRELGIDVVLCAFDLHRLSASALDDLVGTRIPVILLVPRPEEDRWRRLACAVLPLGTSPLAVREALLRAVRGDRRQPSLEPGRDALSPEVSRRPEPSESGESAKEGDPNPTHCTVVAVASGAGSPGRTTVALSLATALGAAAPTILVDSDLISPSLVAYLDADPTRSLYMLAYGEPTTARDWERGIEEETQPLDPRSRNGAILCGVPKPEMRSGVTPAFFEQLIRALRQRYRYVVLDVGSEVLGAEGAVHRMALGLADHVTFVASGDLVGLWQAKNGLKLLESAAGISLDRVSLVLNRHQGGFHHSRAEVEWALGIAAAAVIPEDARGAQRAIAAQRALVLDRGSRAAKQLLDLAERLYERQIRLPPEPGKSRRFAWLSRLRPRLSPIAPLPRPGLRRQRVEETAK